MIQQGQNQKYFRCSFFAIRKMTANMVSQIPGCSFTLSRELERRKFSIFQKKKDYGIANIS